MATLAKLIEDHQSDKYFAVFVFNDQGSLNPNFREWNQPGMVVLPELRPDDFTLDSVLDWNHFRKFSNICVETDMGEVTIEKIEGNVLIVPSYMLRYFDLGGYHLDWKPAACGQLYWAYLVPKK